MRNLVFKVAIVLCLIVSGCVGQALNGYCDTSLAPLMCNTIPKYSNNSIMYNGPNGNASLPWIIGGNDVLTLAAGQYNMGNGLRFGIVPTPAIYIIENAQVLINNTGSLEVAFGADIYLCGNGTLHIINSTLRINNMFSFEYLIWAADTSNIIYEGVIVITIAKSVLDVIPDYGGVFGLHWMRGQSKLTIKTGKSGYGLKSSRFGLDNLEAGAFDNASIIADGIDLMGETYVSLGGTLALSNSQYLDVFFEACPGVPISLSNLPNLCDISQQNSSYGCLTPQQPSITFLLQPPATSFVLNITNTKIFSWAVSSFAGSEINLTNIQKDANFFVGLNINRMCVDRDCNIVLRDTFTILVGPTVYFGLEGTRNMTTTNAYISGYHAWVGDYVKLNITTGSQIGDILPNSNSIIHAENTIANYGMIQISNNNTLYLDSCVIKDSVIVNTQSTLISTGTLYYSKPLIYGNAYFADPIFAGGFPSVFSGAVLTVVHLANATIQGGALIVTGSVSAISAGVPIVPWPNASLTVSSSSGQTIFTSNITSQQDNIVLATPPLASLPSGTVVVRLYFGISKEAVSATQVVIPSTGTFTTSIAPTTKTTASTSSGGATFAPTSTSTSQSPFSTTSTATLTYPGPLSIILATCLMFVLFFI